MEANADLRAKYEARSKILEKEGLSKPVAEQQAAKEVGYKRPFVIEAPGKCECGNVLTPGPGFSDGICHTCNKEAYKKA